LGAVNDIALRFMRSGGVPWKISFLVCLVFLFIGLWAWIYQVEHGLEWSGISHPVNWGVYISNFIFWIGIAHAGTLISAILYLTRARFRISIHRIAEAMTVFAVITAGLFPIIHLGRAWYAFWVFPYPNQRELWANFKSPLVWDAFAIATYLFVSISFLVLGMIPDLASIRDESKGLKRVVYQWLSFGFRGTNRQWLNQARGYLLLAAVATPLVISVHSIVSWDFAVASIPGWHSTLFAPYFVIGAIFSGCAMVLLIIIPLRTRLPELQQIIKIGDLESVAKLLLFSSSLIILCYLTEYFSAFYSDLPYDRSLFWHRARGEQHIWFWLTVFLNCVNPALLWLKRVRTSLWFLFFISLGICIGMWLERFIIVTGSLAHGLDPFTWGGYHFQWAEIWISLGSCGLFFGLILVFLRFLPVIAMAEIKAVLGISKYREL
jgi:molybdopterin-containing oxidoreductase family membrane subunit